MRKAADPTPALAPASPPPAALTTDLATLCDPDAGLPQDPAFPPPVGFGSPPVSGRFTPGVSGNPMGRPRRVALVQPAARRLVPAEPTELELALAQPVICPIADPEPISLARAVVARLTERALVRGDISACRELLRLTAEADATRVARALLAAEAEEDHQAAEAAAAEARAREAEHDADRAREDALDRLEDMLEIAATEAGQPGLSNDLRALVVLDAVECDSGGVTALKPWVADAARAHDPRLPRGPANRPLDLKDLDSALRRLDIERHDEAGEVALAAWFIDAARARAPDRRLPRGDEALLARVRVDPDEVEPDWVARLAAVEAMMEVEEG